MRLQTHTAFGFLFPCLPQNRRSCCCVCLFSQKSGDLFPALFRERIAVAVIRPNFFLVLGEQRDRLDLRPQNQNLFLFLCLFHCLNLALITGDACEDRMIQHGIFLVVQPPEQETQPDLACYGFAQTSGELDDALQALNRVYSDLLELAQAEKTVQLLAQDIERNRRRVNALEHVMIPETRENIRYITMKLEENERGNTTRLMKVKDMVLQDAHHYKS